VNQRPVPVARLSAPARGMASQPGRLRAS
jgi:hypothetical protein